MPGGGADEAETGAIGEMDRRPPWPHHRGAAELRPRSLFMLDEIDKIGADRAVIVFRVAGGTGSGRERQPRGQLRRASFDLSQDHRSPRATCSRPSPGLRDRQDDPGAVGIHGDEENGIVERIRFRRTEPPTASPCSRSSSPKPDPANGEGTYAPGRREEPGSGTAQPVALKGRPPGPPRDNGCQTGSTSTA